MTTNSQTIDPLDPDRLFSTAEAMEFLSISRSWLMHLVEAGDITPLRWKRQMRWRRRDLIAYIDQQIAKSTPQYA